MRPRVVKKSAGTPTYQILKQLNGAALIRAWSHWSRDLQVLVTCNKAFTTFYGSSSGATRSLPQIIQWLTLVRQSVEQQRSEFEAVSVDFRNSQPSGSGTHDHPDYSWVVRIVKEVRDELLSLIPESWKQELLESIDVELLSQILESGSQDIEHLSNVLDYSLGVVLKLAIPANDKESKTTHEKLFHELSEIVAGMDENSNRSFERALVKGLLFNLEQIQVLKQHMSAALIRAWSHWSRDLQVLITCNKAFTSCYGSTSGATRSLPQIVQWLTLVRQSVEQQISEFQAVSTDFRNSQPSGSRTQALALGLPRVTSLRTGGQLDFGKCSPITSANGFTSPSCTGSSSETPNEIKWNSIETLVRLGILQ